MSTYNTYLYHILLIVISNCSTRSELVSETESFNSLFPTDPVTTEITTTTTSAPLIDLHIGGLFPITGTGGWLGGQGCLPAAEMALEDVNNRPYLLPGYHLKLHSYDSECNPGKGSSLLFQLIYNKPIKLLILGGCSIVCSTIAETAKMYNLVVIGYGSSSPALSNRLRFPTFFRTHPSATMHNPTRIKLFKKYGWSRIAIILEAEEVFITTGKDLETRCAEAGIEIVTRVSFLTDPSDAVKGLGRQGARIIVGLFYSGAARKVMCEAFKNNLYGKQYVWWLIGWYEDDWYMPQPGIDCSEEEMLQAIQGHFTTEAVILNQDSKSTIGGFTASAWLERYNKELQNLEGSTDVGKKPEGYQEAPLAYDAIWALALALNKTINRLAKKNISIESFNYENNLIRKVIQEELKATFFLGVSGRVAFSDEGDRIALTKIEQMIDGKYTVLGHYDTQTDKLTFENEEKWIFTGKPPPDRTIIIKEPKTVSTSFFITLSVISVIGIVWALSLILFNLKFKNFRYIQLSHYISNNIMLLGCIICLSSIMLFGLDGQFLTDDMFALMCNARAWSLSIGFSLFFGAMFAKTWFAYDLSTQSSKHKKIKNVQIYLMVVLFCCIDVVILVIWFFQQPMKRHIELFETKAPDITDEDILMQPQLEHCDSKLVWYGILYGYKGLLLIFGLFLAYETRSVKLKQINDSRLVGMSIYNVVIICMITGPVSLVIGNQPTANFAFISFSIIFCCFLSMALIFTPKIVELVRRRGSHNAYGSYMNGTFHETLSSKEEEERFQRLILEGEDLKAKINEKEAQIEEVRKEIEQITRERKSQEERTQKRKAVRIQEPGDEKHLDILKDPVSDSGFVSTTRTRPSDFEFSESYL